MHVVTGSGHHERLERHVGFSDHEVAVGGPRPVQGLHHSFPASHKQNRVDLYP